MSLLGYARYVNFKRVKYMIPIILFFFIVFCIFFISDIKSASSYIWKEIHKLLHEDDCLLCFSTVLQLPFLTFLWEKFMQYLERKSIYEDAFIWHYSFSAISAMVICEVIGIFIMPSPELYNAGFIFVLSAITSFIKQNIGYTKNEINSILKDNKSIGALWAIQAYIAYYEIVLESIRERISEFEMKHDVHFLTKNLVILVPLSCDVSGKLNEKDENIIFLGELRIVENDQGGNVNRKYKNPVYKVLDKCVAAEWPSPLLTLWNLRFEIKSETFVYHRDCFIKQLKFLVKDSPCIVIDYEDSTASDPLHQILLKALSQKYTAVVSIE